MKWSVASVYKCRYACGLRAVSCFVHTIIFGIIYKTVVAVLIIWINCGLCERRRRRRITSLDKMILAPDSSMQVLAVPPAPESPISSVSSHCSRGYNVSIGSCMSSMSPASYRVAQVPHLNPNMPTMDSTVSSARPEPELNIGIFLHPFFRFLKILFFF